MPKLFDGSDENIEFGDAASIFALFAADEFNWSEDEGVKGAPEMDWKMCPDCDVRMQPMKNSYQCMACGRDREVIEFGEEFNASVAGNYNSSAGSSLSIKMTGKDTYARNKALMATTTSDYSAVQFNNTTRQLNRFNAQTVQGKLPIIILKEAATLYGQIQKHVVRRGNGRKGALGGCIYYECNRHNITKKPKEIADFLGICESYLSKGDKLLRRLHYEGKIDIPVHHDPTNSYLYQYFDALAIDEKYTPFVADLIERASRTDMMMENNSRISTKCAGAIYALALQEGLAVKKSDIMNYCKISKSTFQRYYEFLVYNRKVLNEVFERHGIKGLRSKSHARSKSSKSLMNMKSTSEWPVVGGVVEIM